MEATRAVALEPTEAMMHIEVAGLLTALGRYAEAKTQLNEASRLEPENPFPHVDLAELAAAQNDLKTMAEELGKLEDLRDVSRTMLAWATKRGPRQDVVRAIAAIRSRNPALDESRKAWLYANVGETGRALDALEKAVASSRSGASVVQFPSVRKALGSESRYLALVTKTGPR